MLIVKTLEVRPSKIHGNGLFATQDIPAGTHVYCFDPSIDRKSPLGGQSLEDMHFGYISTTDGMLIACGDDAMWWNFGFPPNCEEIDTWVNGERVVVTNRLILAGTELLIDIKSDMDGVRKLMV